MNDPNDNEGNRDGSRDGRGDDRSREHRDRGEQGRGGGGPDTRFLQLELSQVMYTEAEEVTRPAFRALLMEAAKDRLRERFGKEITALARLAVDDLLDGAQASLEIEARIQQYGDERRQPNERLRELFAALRSRGESRRATAGKPKRRAAARAKRKR
jgi:hypothetical protein